MSYNQMIGEYSIDGANTKVYLNGTLETRDNGADLTSPMTLTQLRLGVAVGGTLPLNGYIKEVIVLPFILTTEQRTEFNNGLNAKHLVY